MKIKKEKKRKETELYVIDDLYQGNFGKSQKRLYFAHFYPQK